MRTVLDNHRTGDPYYVVGGTEELFEDIAQTQIRNARQKIYDALCTILPENPIFWVGTKEVAGSLTKLVVRARKDFPGSLVLSLSRIYYENTVCFLDCNRIADRHGNSLGVGPRPNSLSLALQIERLNCQYPGKRFILVDDMLFHGESLENLLTTGLKISAIVTAFAIEKGTKKADELGIPYYVETVVAKLLDMVPIHDWLPPLPLCGKVVGYKVNGQPPQPYEIGGMSVSLPYLAPFITNDQVYDWASIPPEQATAFSVVCLEQSLAIFEILLEKGVFTTMASLVKATPRASYPQYGQITREMLIVDFLRRVLSELGN